MPPGESTDGHLAKGFRPTNWRIPATGDDPLNVQFRGGFVDPNAYTARQLRWTNTQSAWDIIGVKRADAA